MRKSLFLLLALVSVGCSSQPTVVINPTRSAPREPASIEVLDVFDIENLKIYTAQGYLINPSFRELIPLTYLAKTLDLGVAKTCASLLEAEKKKAGSIPYLDRVLVLPYDKVSAKDMKLYILVGEALAKLPKWSGTYYRGATNCRFASDASGRLKSAFIERAFMSVSETKASAENFTRNKNDLSEDSVQKGCLMTLEGESGRRIYDVTGDYGNEREILFPLNASFRMLGHNKIGERVNVTYRELDPDIEKATIDRLKSESYDTSLKTAAVSKRRLSELAEYACSEAYKFFTQEPNARARIDKESPVYDLKNKKLNPDDYFAQE